MDFAILYNFDLIDNFFYVFDGCGKTFHNFKGACCNLFAGILFQFLAEDIFKFI